MHSAEANVVIITLPRFFLRKHVPLTYISTRIWQIRHPGPVGGIGAEGSINGSMRFVVLLGALSFTLFIAGHMLVSMRITDMEQRLERAQKRLDGGN